VIGLDQMAHHPLAVAAALRLELDGTPSPCGPKNAKLGRPAAPPNVASVPLTVIAGATVT
jgi:hypothetical protein